MIHHTNPRDNWISGSYRADGDSVKPRTPLSNFARVVSLKAGALYYFIAGFGMRRYTDVA
jgi:hypothetical protein